MRRPKAPVFKRGVPESVVVRACIDYLNLKRIFHWRQNTGAVKIDTRFVRFSSKGVADIIGALPDGRFLAIECKSTRGKQSGDQELFEENVTQTNGVYLLINDVSQLVKFIEALPRC